MSFPFILQNITPTFGNALSKHVLYVSGLFYIFHWFTANLTIYYICNQFLFFFLNTGSWGAMAEWAKELSHKAGDPKSLPVRGHSLILQLLSLFNSFPVTSFLSVLSQRRLKRPTTLSQQIFVIVIKSDSIGPHKPKSSSASVHAATGSLAASPRPVVES